VPRDTDAAPRGSVRLPLVGAATEAVVGKERQDQNQNLPIKEEPKQNTNGTPEGLPLVGMVSSELHRKEGRKTTHTFSDFMIIFRLENAAVAKARSVKRPGPLAAERK